MDLEENIYRRIDFGDLNTTGHIIGDRVHWWLVDFILYSTWDSHFMYDLKFLNVFFVKV